jgi:hypothetical protein
MSPAIISLKSSLLSFFTLFPYVEKNDHAPKKSFSSEWVDFGTKNKANEIRACNVPKVCPKMKAWKTARTTS